MKTYRLKVRGRDIELGHRTCIMGILNVTPDSFSDGGRFSDFNRAADHAFELIAQGADILDVGGETTKPGSEPVTLDTELERVIPIVRVVREKSDIPISVDTNKAEVAARAIEAGADIINDISALQFDSDMAGVAARTGAPLILMHMQGTPRIMQKDPVYSSLLSEIVTFLEERIRYAMDRGVAREQIIVDPGVGFGKTTAHNLSIIRNLGIFTCLDRPILLGVSRKRFIGSVLGRKEGEREVGTAVANVLGIAAGAHILRVHDVAFHREAAVMADAICGAEG